MIRYYFTRYLLSYPRVLLYMLQNTEYNLPAYVAWFHRTDDFRKVMKRRRLEVTKKIALLLITLRVIALVLIAVAVDAVVFGIVVQNAWWIAGGIIVAITAPFVMAYGIMIPLFIGRLLIQKPKERALKRRAEKIFAKHPGIRIAVAGSYGKTTVKEILTSVIGTGMKVAATPGNMNTLIGISRYAAKLAGDEEVLIIELGEEREGDVRELAELVSPDIAIITGINEAHLGSFGSLDTTAATILALGDFVKDDSLYLNGENEFVRKYRGKQGQLFSEKSVGAWHIKNVSTSLQGTRFTMQQDGSTIKAHTSLIGTHTIGVSATAAAIASKLGVSTKNIEKGLRAVVPFEHRMQPRQLHGAWIIDDTYNGNSDGVRAGLAFLKTVKATRRIYVTPGLVEQGSRTQEVHERIGELAATSADVIVLMVNSTTKHIMKGLEHKKFSGQLILQDNPLEFYTHLEQFVAAGDVVLMQNDWTDNYQ
jgi:UDP-N-acetylmuramoyl-tripeptide--D-alanyl-D-alanine ligase